MLKIIPNMKKVDTNTPKSIDIEDLKYWYRKNLCSIDTVLPICNKIINENIQSYEKIFNSLKSWDKK